MDCRLWTNKGIALLMMLAMISSLVGVVMICAFVLSHEVNKDERHQITRQRMLEVKRALIGRLADVSGGEDIASCGGFISDYGEPNSINTYIAANFIPVLLDELDPTAGPDTWLDWHYEPTPPLYPNDYQFWAGYRVVSANEGRYLASLPAQPNPITEFWDGWGYEIEVNFVDDNGSTTIDPGENRVEIKSRGEDNLWDTGPGADTAYYGKDIVDTFYWRRDVQIINGTSGPADFTVVYPQYGSISLLSSGIIGVGANFSFSDIPIGSRKIEVRTVVLGPVVSTKMVCIPSGSGAYTVTVD